MLGARPAADWQERLHRVGIACGQVNDLSRALHYAESLGLSPMIDPGDGAAAQVRSPVEFTATGVVDPIAPPRLGEHDAEVRDWLAADPTALAPLTDHPSRGGPR